MNQQILYKNDKITIELLQIKIEKTYRNLLCGLPNEEINNLIIANEIKSANLFCETDNVFFIEPLQIEIPFRKEIYRLPSFVCVAKMISYSTNTNLLDVDFNSFYHEFSLLWFQDNLSINIPENINEHIIKKSGI